MDIQSLSVPGLRNLGNTCYANTALQALASCSSLLRQLQQTVAQLQQLAPEQQLRQAIGFTAVLLDCLERLQPVAAALAPHTESPGAVLHALRRRVGPGVLPEGGEHDAVEAFEIIMALVAAELQQAFARWARPPLEAHGALAALLPQPAPGQPIRPVLCSQLRTTPSSPFAASAAQQPQTPQERSQQQLGQATTMNWHHSPLKELGGPAATHSASSHAKEAHSSSNWAPGSSEQPAAGGQAAGAAELGGGDCLAPADLGVESAHRPDIVLSGWAAMTQLACQGSLASELQCISCRHKFASLVTPFWALPLGIPLAPGGARLGSVAAAPGATLEDCLLRFFGYEVLEGVTCTRCSLLATLAGAEAGGAGLDAGLQGVLEALRRQAPLVESDLYQALVRRAGLECLPVRRLVAKRQLAARLPPVLFLQLRRAFWTPVGEYVKVSGRVRFPLTLRLEGLGLPQLGHAPPPVTAGQPGGAAGGGGPWRGAQVTVPGDDGGECADEGRHQQSPYRLRAVLQHVGGASSRGHYITYRCLGAAGLQWARVSDESVAEGVPVQEVLATEAAALVYERCAA